MLKIVPELAGSWPRFSPLGSVILSAPAYGDTTSIKEDDLHDRLGSNIRVLGAPLSLVNDFFMTLWFFQIPGRTTLYIIGDLNRQKQKCLEERFMIFV